MADIIRSMINVTGRITLLIWSAFIALFSGLMLLCFAIATVLIAIWIVMLPIGIVMYSHYTFFEWIPYTRLALCSDLNIAHDTYVWNSPLTIPKEMPKDIKLIKCKASAFGYEGGGIPLFTLGTFDPPYDFPIQPKVRYADYYGGIT